MLCDPVSGLPIVTVSTLSNNVDPYLLPLQSTSTRLGVGGLMGNSEGGYETANNNNPSSLLSPRGPTITLQTASSPTALSSLPLGSPASGGRKRGVSFAPAGGLGPFSPTTTAAVTQQQPLSPGDDSSPGMGGGRKRRMSIVTADTRNSSVVGLSSPRGDIMDGGGASSDPSSSQLRPQSVYDWLGRCMPAVRIPGAPTKMVSTDSNATAPRHPILLHCTPALKLPQHDVGKVGYKRRLVVCTRDELLCFREDGLMKVRIGWDSIQTAQHIPVSVRLPADGRITSTTTTTSNGTAPDTTSIVHVVLLITNSTSRDVGLVFRSGQDAQTLINIAVIRKRQITASSSNSGGYDDGEDRASGCGELTVYRRDLAAPPISSSQLQTYLSSGGVVALKRPPNQAPLPSTVPTIELLSSSSGSDVGAIGSIGGGVLYQAIHELQREADRCKHETATAATTTHWSLLSQYRDAINYASEKKIELDASRRGYLRRHDANETTLDKVKQNLAEARAELRSVSTALLSTRDGHDKRISKLREECHNSEERSKSIVINTNHDDMNLSSKRQKALLDRNRLSNEVSELRELLGELRRQCPSSSEEKEVEIQSLRKELRKLEQRTNAIREESSAIKYRIQQGGALTKLTSVRGDDKTHSDHAGSGAPSRSDSLRPINATNISKAMSGTNTSDVMLYCGGDGVEVSAVFELDDDDNPITPNNIPAVESLQLEGENDNEDTTSEMDVDFVYALKSLERYIEESEAEKSTLEAAVYRTELALRNTKVLIHKQQQSAELLADAIHNQNLRNMEVANQRRALETEVHNLERRVSLFSMETMIVDDARRETHLHVSIADTASRSYDFTAADESHTSFASPLSRNSRLTFSSGSPASTTVRDAIAGLAALNKEATQGGDSNEQRVASQLEHLRRIKERLQRTVDGTY